MEHIYLIPGNHDLERGKTKMEKDENRKRILEIRDAYSASAGNFKEDDLLSLKEQWQFFIKSANFCTKRRFHGRRSLFIHTGLSITQLLCI